jgi:hypothetical protein
MAITYSNFFAPTVLGIAAATLFTVPTTPTTTLLRGGRVRMTNTTGVAQTVTLYAVPSAGAAGVGNAFLSAKSIAGNDYLDVDVPIMPAGAFMQGLASLAASITIQPLAGSYFS